MSKQTKSQLVRDIIAQAKAQGQDAAAVLPAVMQLGFARQLARAYIKGNWDRVEAAVQVAATVRKAQRELSMSKDAIRKREARARAAAAKAAAAATVATAD